MRPTIASDDYVFDFKTLLGTVFEHLEDVVAHPSLTLAESGPSSPQRPLLEATLTCITAVEAGDGPTGIR
jgi:hypothetical protein